MANTVETMLAKQDIRDVLTNYARAVDRADAPLLKSCYHADAIEEHGNTYTGPAHAYADGAAERLMKLKHPMAHYVCNIHVDLDLEAGVAFVESYLLTFARFDKGQEPWDTLTGGRIVDRFECRDGEWKIAHRKMAFDWNRDMPVAEGWCLGLFKPEDPRVIMGTRGSADLSYQRF
ncbi:nuclear transport factor 2 family protein [Kordiimonas sp.]|uniref:nuclear transport factor 2 family protein n=1 Tax=Kordiimonas sp. TaxID=1970157 RepID=UPI003A959F1C